MPIADQLTTLTVLIALSAYLGTIRLLAIDRLRSANSSEPKSPSKEKSIKGKLMWLTLADIPLTVASLLLAINIFGGYLTETPSTLYIWSIWLCAVAGVVLFISHLFAWIKSISEFIKTHWSC